MVVSRTRAGPKPSVRTASRPGNFPQLGRADCYRAFAGGCRLSLHIQVCRASIRGLWKEMAQHPSSKGLNLGRLLPNPHSTLSSLTFYRGACRAASEALWQDTRSPPGYGTTTLRCGCFRPAARAAGEGRDNRVRRVRQMRTARVRAPRRARRRCHPPWHLLQNRRRRRSANSVRLAGRSRLH